MLLEAHRCSIANRVEDVLAGLPASLATRVSAETHACVLELKTRPRATVAGLTGELCSLRRDAERAVSERLGLRLAASGTHPCATPADVRVTDRPRQRRIGTELQWLARREPTMALHVHVRVPDGAGAVRALDGLRGDLPVLLALAANSPYVSGRDTGFASARTPIFSAFPRSGMPRRFGTYAAYASLVETMVRSGSVPDPSFLWWDVRLQRRLGTVEVRVMDAQTRPADVGALAALVQCLVHRYAGEEPAADLPAELLAENRVLAARDGLAAKLLSERGRPRHARDLLADLVDGCRFSAAMLRCRAELDHVERLADDPGHQRQRRLAARDGLVAVPVALADTFVDAADRVALAKG